MTTLLASPWWPVILLGGLVLLILLHRPLQWLFRLAARSVAALGFLLLWGQSGLLAGMALGANFFNALTLGLLGLPGLGLLLLFRWMTPG